MIVVRWIADSVWFVLRWIVRYPVVGICAALLVGIVTFDLGSGLGLPDLFWHQHQWLKTFSNGAALASMFTLFCFVGYLLESKDGVVARRQLKFRQYAARVYTLLFALLLLGAWLHRTEKAAKTGNGGNVMLLLGGHLFMLAVMILTAAVILPRLRRSGAAASAARKFSRIPAAAQYVPLHIFAAVLLGVLATAYVILAFVMPPLPAGVAICIVFGVIVQAYGAVRYYLPRAVFIIFAALFVISGLVNACTAYKHRYPDLEAYYEPPPPIAENTTGLLGDKAAFSAWLAQAKGLAAGAPPPKLVVVAVSGGGIRAAVWTGTVLDHLDRAIPHFARHTRIITGASGGMVGAASYVASVLPPGTRERATGVEKLAADSLEPVARTLALRDLPMLLLPRLPGNVSDRGVALERKWKADNPALTMNFSELRKGEEAGWRPSIVFTPALAEDGRRLVVSNLDLGFLGEHRGAALRDVPVADIGYSRPALQLFKVLPAEARDRLTLAGAARMSASFPWVTPAAELPTRQRRHVLDAGYWDNYGVSAAAMWIERNFQEIANNTSGVVLVQIRDVTEEDRSQAINRPEEPDLALSGFSEFAAPVIGALNARGSTMVFRNDHDTQQLSRAFCNQTGDRQFFTTIVLEYPETAALSWALTQGQAAKITRHFGTPNTAAAKRVKALQTWWTRKAPAAKETCSDDTLVAAAVGAAG